MMRRIGLLALNDLAVSFRNKTVYLMCFVPLFVVFVLSVVDKPSDVPLTAKLGLIRGTEYPQGAVEAIQSAPALFVVSWLDSEAAGKKALLDSSLDGVLAPASVDASSAMLLVLKQDTLMTLTLVDGLARLQRQVEARNGGSWISRVSALMEDKGMQGQTITIWILMLVLLVGFLVLPPQIAEEKEKKLILGLLQAPIREEEWLAAKVVTGMGLALGPIALLHLATRMGVLHAGGYLVLLLAGSFCFASMGALLGLLCKSQGSARALGVVFYLPHLLPSALSDYSKMLSSASVFVPSYHFFTPVKAMILEDATLGLFLPQVFGLLLMGALCCSGASLILRHRWFM